MKHLNEIKELIYQGDIEPAIAYLGEILQSDSLEKDQAYYLRGNAYRKLGNWQQALNDYTRAIDLNPVSPATEARKMIMNILEFYNKDMYNQ